MPKSFLQCFRKLQNESPPSLTSVKLFVTYVRKLSLTHASSSEVRKH